MTKVGVCLVFCWLSLSGPASWKAQSALISQLPQAWAGTTPTVFLHQLCHCFCNHGLSWAWWKMATAPTDPSQSSDGSFKSALCEYKAVGGLSILILLQHFCSTLTCLITLHNMGPFKCAEDAHWYKKPRSVSVFFQLMPIAGVWHIRLMINWGLWTVCIVWYNSGATATSLNSSTVGSKDSFNPL